MKKICVLGATGFLGSEICRELRRYSAFANSELVLVDRKPPSDHGIERFVSADAGGAELRKALAGSVACVNLAAKIFSASSAIEEAMVDLLEASLGPIHALFPVIKETLRFWLQVSSISVYRKPESGEPLSEDHPLAPISAYGLAKLAAEEYLTCAASSQNFSLTILRMPDLYGHVVRDARDRRTLPEMMRALRDQREWCQFGDGSNIVDLLHVHDAARGVVRVLASGKAGTWNLGSGGGIAMKDVLSSLAEVSPHPLKLILNPDRKLQDLVLDCSRFRRDFAFVPEVDLRAGLQEEFGWHLSTPGTL